MCSPPAKRSMAETSALRTEDFLMSSRESSSLTDAVSAMAPFLLFPKMSWYAVASRSGSWIGRRPDAPTLPNTTSAPSIPAACSKSGRSDTDAGSARTTSIVKSGAYSPQHRAGGPRRTCPRFPWCPWRGSWSGSAGPACLHSASRISGSSRCGSTEVYQDPGPRITQSASSIAVERLDAGRGVVRQQPDVFQRAGDGALRLPVDGLQHASCRPARRRGRRPRWSAGRVDIGRTSPRAPSRAPAHLSPATVSPRSSHRVTISRFPMAWSSSEPPRPLPGGSGAA